MVLHRSVLQGVGEAVAAVRLDAWGKVIAPGFIDVLTHSEDIAELPEAENFLRMGVTTIVTGNCGSSDTDIAKFFGKVEAAKCAVNVATLWWGIIPCGVWRCMAVGTGCPRRRN